MTTDRDIERVLDEWFVDGPEHIADWVVDEALLQIERIPYRGGVLRLPRRTTMFGPLRLTVAGAAVVAVAAIGVGLLSRNAEPPGGAATPSPAITPAPTVAAPSAAAAIPTALPAEGEFVFPGRYVTKFSQGLSLTVDDRVVLVGCTAETVAAAECRGEVDVDGPGWVNIEFGPPRFEIQVFRLDKVFDPARPGELIDPPADLASWIASRPGILLDEPPTAVQVGGLDATKLEIRTSREIELAPIPGITEIVAGLNQGASVRMFVLTVDGAQVVIWISAKDLLQPMVDSITWG